MILRLMTGGQVGPTIHADLKSFSAMPPPPGLDQLCPLGRGCQCPVEEPYWDGFRATWGCLVLHRFGTAMEYYGITMNNMQ